jgi:hypothetical protein
MPGLPAHAPRKNRENSGTAAAAEGSSWCGRGFFPAPAREAGLATAGEAAEAAGAVSGRAWRWVILLGPVSKREKKKGKKAVMVGACCRGVFAGLWRHLRDSGAAQCVQPGGPPAAFSPKTVQKGNPL